MKTDSQLQADVMEALKWEPIVDESQIGMNVKDGVVTLTGSVPYLYHKTAAEQAAKRVYGVKAVADEIEVRVTGTGQRSDTEIARAAVDALMWDASVPEDKIKVTLNNGWVKLDGEVEWGYQRKAAEEDVRRLIGVKGITNLITVKPKASAIEVKTKIESAFRRSAEIDARRIGVEVRDGKVVLHGNVRSWIERDEAERAAQAAPGVRNVENDLAIVP
jgi:osmotically-inducible protein OsmY